MAGVTQAREPARTPVTQALRPATPATLRRCRAWCAKVALVVVLATPVRAASLYDPLLRFRTLSTEHFVIYFHQGEDAIARRLAVIAEETWRTLQQPMRVTPPRRTHVVLVDQTELANGWANPMPYDTISVSAAWPAAVDFIGDTDDWLRLVFTHEFTHILHLDRSESWARIVRRIFGRMELAFPNLFLPTWQIEGIATYQESAITGGGRLHAGDFAALVREAARNHRLEPIDRVNGALTDWPGGNAPYAYGLGFHQYLADRFGTDTLAALADATARRLPYTGSRAFTRVFGEPLGVLWKEYEASLEKNTPARMVSDVGLTRLTHHGFAVAGPRFDRVACAACPLEVIYSVRTPHGFPALNRLALDGSAPRHITRRFLGSTTAIGADAVYFDQQEVRRNTGLYSDLFAWSRATGRVTQVTSEARLLDPDLSPDGRTLVCVQDRPGQRNLVLVRLKANAPVPVASGSLTAVASAEAVGQTVTIEALISEPETQFNAPRWSPDGRLIAVERHRPGASSEVVLVEVATKTVRRLASVPGARVVTPAWRPDGRAIVAAVAPRDEPFNLHEYSIDDTQLSRQLTRTTGGATWPDMSPDGQTMVFVGYTIDGFDLFTMPYPPAAPGAGAALGRPRVVPDPQSVVASDPESVVGQRFSGADAAEPTPYSPWPTLRPTSWTPIVDGDSSQWRISAATGGFDVLGYHFYAASATWLASGPDDAPRPRAATPDWELYYAYDRWRPTLWVSASNATSFFSGPATDAGTPTAATLRARQLEGGVVFPIRHVRVSHLALFSMLSAVDQFTQPTTTFSRERTALRGAWATTSAHTYGYSISPEGGVTAGMTAESVPRVAGSFERATAFTADGRAYLPGLAPHHVLAVRAAGGVSTGDPDVRRTFHLGGAAPNDSVIDFDRDAISLLRGFGANTFAGSHVALVNVDYRLPIARPQRGYGTWPLFLHTIHAAVFADAGHVWTRAFRSAAIKTSAGAELSANVVAGYFFPFTVTAGAAWGHDGSGTVRDGAIAYARLGVAF